MMQYDVLEMILTFRQLPVELIWNKEDRLHLKYEYFKPWKKNEKFTNKLFSFLKFPLKRNLRDRQLEIEDADPIFQR